MSTKTVIPIRPGVASATPVKNPKTRGRPKGTVSLSIERRRREAAAAKAAQSPYHPSVVPRPVERGRYQYPKELLLQECICKNSYGWMLPNLSASALGNQRPNKSCSEFISPLNQLISQLEAEGHDIGGARMELMAMRDVITTYLGVSQNLMFVRASGIDEFLRNAPWDIEFDGYRRD